MIWKTMGGHCIYQIPQTLTIYQNFFYRWLTFQSTAIQTLIHRKYPEKIALAYAHELTLFPQIKPGNCCLLGLGGGGVAHALQPYMQNFSLIAIEKEQDVIDIAKHYFMIDRIPQLSIAHQPAEVFVEQCDTQYSYVLVDLFNAHTFPNECLTEHFFTHCGRILLPDGILAFNIANQQEQRIVWQHIQRVFHHNTISFPVKGCTNVVVWACRSPTFTFMMSLLKQSNRLKKLSWDPLWGHVAEIKVNPSLLRTNHLARKRR